MNAPKLRFKEFSGEWKSKKLGDLLEFKNGINASKEQYGHGKKFINVLDILNNNYITYENIIGKVDVDEDTFKKYSVGYGDIVFQRSSETREEVGTANVYLDKEFKATFGGFIIRGKKIGDYEPTFMNNLLKSSSARKEITTKSGGSTRYNVGQETLSDVSLLFPKLEEQEKIASLFSLMDKKIELQNDKVYALKDYKKGVMQKIFSQELRFKDDNSRDYPNWEEKKLGLILEEVSEKTKDNNQYEVISSTTNGLFLQREYFNREIASSDNTGYKILKKNQVVLSPQNLWMGNINFNDKYDIGIVSPSYKIFDINREFNRKYIGYILRTPRAFYEYMQSSEQGASIVRRNLNIDLFNEIVFKIPCKKEQDKIANFICSIDGKIQIEQEKLNFLNQYKKGLLQQMFV
ncbi:restriction endonuclease subunit S [Paraclostridium bifermentans]